MPGVPVTTVNINFRDNNIYPDTNVYAKLLGKKHRI
jgi:hypothetical protein